MSDLLGADGLPINPLARDVAIPSKRLGRIVEESIFNGAHWRVGELRRSVGLPAHSDALSGLAWWLNHPATHRGVLDE